MLPAAIYLLVMFVYPFAYGVVLSLQAKDGGLSLATYTAFPLCPWQARTIWVTASIAVPNTVLTVLLALVVAYRTRRGMWMERTITTALVLPIALGTVLVAEGINGFYGPKGWLNQGLLAVGITDPPRLTHNYTGVMIALLVQHFPFCFLMLLGYVSGIDPALEAAARVLGAGPWGGPRRPRPDGGNRRGHHGRGEALMGRIWRLAVFLFVVGFVLNLVGIVSHVVVSSFARRWFSTPLPGGFTAAWYAYSWREFQLDQVLTVTLVVAASVTALALGLGFPAAYLLARHDFRAKNALLLLFFLPLLIPQMTYGIPLATTLYRYRIGGTVAGVIAANLVP